LIDFLSSSERHNEITSICSAALDACLLRPSAEPADRRLR